jgi:hypothetical protein
MPRWVKEKSRVAPVGFGHILTLPPKSNLSDRGVYAASTFSRLRTKVSPSSVAPGARPDGRAPGAVSRCARRGRRDGMEVDFQVPREDRLWPKSNRGNATRGGYGSGVIEKLYEQGISAREFGDSMAGHQFD